MALTLIYCDGFDTLDSLPLSSWDAFGTDCLIDLTGTKSRTGLGCLFIRSAAFGPRKSFPAANQFIMATAFNPAGALPVGNKGNIMWLLDSTTAAQQVRICWNPDGSVSALNSTDPFPLILGTSAPNIINPVGYNYITAKCVVNASGSVQIRVNGAVVLSVTGRTSVPGSNGKADTFQLLTFGGLASYHDDVMIWGFTAPGDDIPQSPNIWSFTPSADDTTVQWTPSTGTQHFPLVNSVPEDLTKFNSDATIGELDHYIHSLSAPQNHPPFPASVQILGVQHDLLLEESSGAGSVASDVAGVTSSDFALTNSFKSYPYPYGPNNPATGVPWVVADFPITGVGPKVTA